MQDIRPFTAKALALATIAAVPQLAFAQAGAGVPAGGAVATSDEIVVTAQKRQERLTDVPITIHAISGDALRAAGVRNLEDVANLTSNTQVFEINGSSQPVWMIRGVGIIDFNTNNTPSSAVYFDEIYQNSSVFGSFGMYDIDRVEILKGPQGGLYGRNTSGGAVRVMTRAPDLAKPTGEASISYGRWGRLVTNAAISVPIVTDKLAVRLSGRVQSASSGWQYSLASNRRWGKTDVTELRGQILAKPTDNFTLRVILDAGRDKSQTIMGRAIGAYDPAESSASFPGFCAAVLAGHLDDSTCLTFQKAYDAGAPSPSVQPRGGRRVLADAYPRNDNHSFGVTTIADLDLGGATLTGIFGYRDFDWGQLQDNDAVPGEWGHQISGSHFKSYSGELRLVSAADQPLTWLLGVNYAKDDLNEHRTFLARENGFVFFNGVYILDYKQKSESWAVYGQLNYKLNDAVTLSGSLRYTDDRKRYDDGQVYFAPDFPVTPANALFDPVLSDRYKLKNHLSGNASINWKTAPNSSVYASISRGYKSGGFFGGYGFTRSAVTPYKEETVWAYELGTKNSFANGRFGLNAALFYNDYKDVQTFGTTWDPVLGPQTQMTNVGDARHLGVEVEGFVKPVENLRLGGSIAYLDAKLRNTKFFYSQAQELLTYNGLRRFFAPKWSWTASIDYDLSLQSAGSLRFHADANGRTTLFDAGYLVDPVTLQKTGPRSNVDHALTHVPGYSVANGRITYQPADGNWDLSVWGKNFLNKKYVTIWGGDGLGSYWQMWGEPFSYGVEASIRW